MGDQEKPQVLKCVNKYEPSEWNISIRYPLDSSLIYFKFNLNEVTQEPDDSQNDGFVLKKATYSLAFYPDVEDWLIENNMVVGYVLTHFQIEELRFRNLTEASLFRLKWL